MMGRSSFKRFLLFSLASAALVLSGKGASAGATTYVIRAGRLIVDPSQPARGASTLVVENGRISRIDEGFTDTPAGAVLIDLSAKTVLPGLIDVHVHLENGNGGDSFSQKNSDAYKVAVGLKNALETARGGFTTVRNLGGQTLPSLAVRDAIKDGLHPGPRILTSGREFSITGGVGDITAGLRPELAAALEAHDPQVTLCAGVDGCREAVRRQAKLGVDVIKVYATGAVFGGSNGLEQQFTDDELRAIGDTAHQLGLKVAAHAHGARGIEAAVRAGVDSIEHGTFADDIGIRLMKERKTFFVATLRPASRLEEELASGALAGGLAQKARQIIDARGKALRNAYRRGVPIALGSDAGVFPHGDNVEELLLMIKHGELTPRDALVAATKGGAALLGLSGEIGTLEPGKSADLIAVDTDPVADPQTLTKILFVMAEGRVVPLDSRR